jgi:uncharacterized protein DUF3311
MSKTTPRSPISRGRFGSRISGWNVFLLVPLLMLLTPLFNTVNPRLFGLPFFYWFQLAGVFLGVACVSVVYLATRTGDVTDRRRR